MVEIEIVKNQLREDVYSSRLSVIGVSAYGKTQREADASLLKMIAKWVVLHYNSGTLEKTLENIL